LFFVAEGFVRANPSHRPCLSAGFSLVELLVVIAIIGLLLAVLLPSLSQARESARRVRCAANQKQIVLSTILYSDAHNTAVPYAHYYNPASQAKGAFYGPSRRELYLNYGANNTLLWWCPSAIHRNTPPISRHYFKEDWFLGTPSVSGFPAASTIVINGVTIAYSNNRDQTGYYYFVGQGRGFTGEDADTYQMQIITRFNQLRDPANRIVWADVLQAPGGTNGGMTSWQQPANTHDTGGDFNPVGANSAFADGHVAWRQYRNGDNVMNWGASGQWQYFIYKP
jgi:prepilin-type N-terminal cleavage/methylation domain-containing protein/prepilin-type processing-associated H-X9-DG protein